MREIEEEARSLGLGLRGTHLHGGLRVALGDELMKARAGQRLPVVVEWFGPNCWAIGWGRTLREALKELAAYMRHRKWCGRRALALSAAIDALPGGGA